MKQQFILAAGVLALAATPAFAGPPAHAGKGKHANHNTAFAQPGCPPGLAKKSNGCLPPGQAKKLYDIGHRFPSGFDRFTPYDRIPYEVRNRYDLDPYGRYIYDQNYVYRVDPTTLIVREILDAIF